VNEMVAYMGDSEGSPDWIRELPRLACPVGSGVTPGSTRGGITGFRKGENYRKVVGGGGGKG